MAGRADPPSDNSAEARHDPSLRLVRLKDPNEALGLALRQLSGVAPFRDIPLGLSTGALIEAIDMNAYAFAIQGSRARGIVAWRPCLAVEAEAWLFGPKQRTAPRIVDAPDAVIVLAVQADSREVTRFLHRAVGDGPLRGCSTFYYVRDYGRDGGRPARRVRLHRPRAA